MNVSHRVDDFVQACQDRGFDPAGAFLLYKELDVIAAPRVLHPTLASADDRRHDAMFRRMGETLLAVQRPEDWRAYCENFPAMLTGHPPGKLALDHRIALGEELRDTWDQHIPQESFEELVERLTMLSGFHGLSRYRKAAEGMTWKRLKQVMLADSMGPTLGGDGQVPATTMEQAEAAMGKALQATSVRSVRWNWVDGDGPAQRTALAQGLMTAQAELQQRTGWDGPVLGLNGRLRLALGGEHMTDGCMSSFDDHTSQINTSADVGWKVTGHEWFHALDNLLGDAHGWGNDDLLSLRWSFRSPFRADEGTPEQRRSERALNVLLNALLVQQGSPQTQEQAMDEARGSWAERMLHAHPWAGEMIDAEHRRLKKGTWTRERSIEAWQDGIARHERTSDSVHGRILAELAVTEIEFLTTAERSTSRTGSVWRQFLSRVDHNLRRLKVIPHGHTILGYFQKPDEALAHSFEATFKPGVGITDVQAGATSLRYPTRTEGKHHQALWRTFFNDVRPEWDRMCQRRAPRPAIPNRQRMSDRIVASAPTDPSGGAVRPSQRAIP